MSVEYSLHVVPDVTTDDSPCYLAYHPELEGCMSHGATVVEAINNLNAARELYLATLRQLGQPIPSPIAKAPAVVWESSAGLPKASESESNTVIPSVELTARH
jgi:predicted RNase H-like HicB family nuclease